ncbi:hypothetical protein HW555_009716 [Spodoptera exigua]|uniref:Uncharacterized protein n=1 Tax=Spodoptera exigua TaxID=7107 RepID=A0A835GBF3_SPOEX|nr:hypothetical protein HW555_009716 [Spodoptera exigua]
MQKMPRIRKRKTTRAQCSLNQYEDAYKELNAGLLCDKLRKCMIIFIVSLMTPSTVTTALGVVGLTALEYNCARPSNSILSRQSLRYMCAAAALGQPRLHFQIQSQNYLILMKH